MAGLDDIDAEPVQLFGDGHLDVAVKKNAGRLLAFTQGRIEYGDHDRPPGPQVRLAIDMSIGYLRKFAAILAAIFPPVNFYNKFDLFINFCYNCNMKSISDAVKQKVLHSPFLEAGLASGIINLSALARQIKPEIESRLVKDTSDGAMIMALKRLADELREDKLFNQDLSRFFGDITIRSQISEFTFLKSKSIVARQIKLLQEMTHHPDAFITFTSGVFEITILVSGDMKEKVAKTFRPETMVSSFERLSAVILRLSDDTVLSPGIYYLILKQLAWENINLMEVVSTFREFIIVIQNSQVDRAFSILKALIWK
jgi:hypothetical protein